MADFEKRIYEFVCDHKECTEERIFDILHNGAESKELYRKALDDLRFLKRIFMVRVIDTDLTKTSSLPRYKLVFIADIHIKEYEGNTEYSFIIDPQRA